MTYIAEYKPSTFSSNLSGVHFTQQPTLAKVFFSKQSRKPTRIINSKVQSKHFSFQHCGNIRTILALQVEDKKFCTYNHLKTNNNKKTQTVCVEYYTKQVYGHNSIPT